MEDSKTLKRIELLCIALLAIFIIWDFYMAYTKAFIRIGTAILVSLGLLSACATEAKPALDLCGFNLQTEQVQIYLLNNNNDNIQTTLSEYVPKCCATWNATCGGETLVLNCRDHFETWHVEDIYDDGSLIVSIKIQDGPVEELKQVRIARVANSGQSE